MRYDLLNFTNIDNEDFIGKWGGEEYLIKAGKTKAFPKFLVDHFTKHLVDKILIHKGVNNYQDPTHREPLEKQIQGDVILEKTSKETKTEGQKVKDEVEKTQKEFEELEEKRQAEIKEKRLSALAKAREAKAKKK